MGEWERLGTGEDAGYGQRTLFLAHVESLANWREVVDGGNGKAVNALFLATERMPDVDHVGALAEHLMQRDMFYVCCWGEGCELAHDVFEESEVWLNVQREEQENPVSDSVVMTTWHADKSLDEAFDFFWRSTHPAKGKEWGPNYLALAVGSERFFAAVRGAATAL